MSSHGGKLVWHRARFCLDAPVRLLRVACLSSLILVQALGTPLGAQSAPTVRLFWDANTEVDLAGYVLVWGVVSGVYLGSSTLGPTEVSYEAPCPSGTTYVYAIRAFNTAGLHSAYSNEVRVTCGGLPVRVVPRALGNVVVVVVRRG